MRTVPALLAHALLHPLLKLRVLYLHFLIYFVKQDFLSLKYV